jgi:hypothetical protein
MLTRLTQRIASLLSRSATPAAPTISRVAFGELEALEGRQLRSASPNFAGDFIGKFAGERVAIDLKATSKAGHYDGTMSLGSVSFSVVGHTSNQKLVGALDDDGTDISLKAALRGQEMVASMDGITFKLMNHTPTSTSSSSGSSSSTSLPLQSETGTYFTYAAPSGWYEEDTTNGIAIASPDGTQLVASVGGVVSGTVTPDEVAQQLSNDGAQIVYANANSTTVNGTPMKDEVILAKFTASNGTPYATGMVITTENASGGTAVMATSVTAPVSQFKQDLPTLVKVAQSVQPIGSMVADAVRNPNGGAVTRDYYYWPDDYYYYGDYYGGFFDPGAYDDWSYDGNLDYSADPWLAYEQSSVAYSTEVTDDSAENFDDYIIDA